jgi:hypothetical protein
MAKACAAPGLDPLKHDVALGPVTSPMRRTFVILGDRRFIYGFAGRLRVELAAPAQMPARDGSG